MRPSFQRNRSRITSHSTRGRARSRARTTSTFTKKESLDSFNHLIVISKTDTSYVEGEIVLNFNDQEKTIPIKQDKLCPSVLVATGNVEFSAPIACQTCPLTLSALLKTPDGARPILFGGNHSVQCFYEAKSLKTFFIDAALEHSDGPFVGSMDLLDELINVIYYFKGKGPIPKSVIDKIVAEFARCMQDDLPTHVVIGDEHFDELLELHKEISISSPNNPIYKPLLSAIIAVYTHFVPIPVIVKVYESDPYKGLLATIFETITPKNLGELLCSLRRDIDFLQLPSGPELTGTPPGAVEPDEVLKCFNALCAMEDPLSRPNLFLIRAWFVVKYTHEHKLLFDGYTHAFNFFRALAATEPAAFGADEALRQHMKETVTRMDDTFVNRLLQLVLADTGGGILLDALVSRNLPEVIVNYFLKRLLELIKATPAPPPHSLCSLLIDAFSRLFTEISKSTNKSIPFRPSCYTALFDILDASPAFGVFLEDEIKITLLSFVEDFKRVEQRVFIRAIDIQITEASREDSIRPLLVTCQRIYSGGSDKSRKVLTEFLKQQLSTFPDDELVRHAWALCCSFQSEPFYIDIIHPRLERCFSLSNNDRPPYGAGATVEPDDSRKTVRQSVNASKAYQLLTKMYNTRNAQDMLYREVGLTGMDILYVPEPLQPIIQRLLDAYLYNFHDNIGLLFDQNIFVLFELNQRLGPYASARFANAEDQIRGLVERIVDMRTTRKDISLFATHDDTDDPQKILQKLIEALSIDVNPNTCLRKLAELLQANAEWEWSVKDYIGANVKFQRFKFLSPSLEEEKWQLESAYKNMNFVVVELKTLDDSDPGKLAPLTFRIIETIGNVWRASLFDELCSSLNDAISESVQQFLRGPTPHKDIDEMLSEGLQQYSAEDTDASESSTPRDVEPDNNFFFADDSENPSVSDEFITDELLSLKFLGYDFPVPPVILTGIERFYDSVSRENFEHLDHSVDRDEDISSFTPVLVSPGPYSPPLGATDINHSERFCAGEEIFTNFAVFLLNVLEKFKEILCSCRFNIDFLFCYFKDLRPEQIDMELAFLFRDPHLNTEALRKALHYWTGRKRTRLIARGMYEIYRGWIVIIEIVHVPPELEDARELLFIMEIERADDKMNNMVYTNDMVIENSNCEWFVEGYTDEEAAACKMKTVMDFVTHCEKVERRFTHFSRHSTDAQGVLLELLNAISNAEKFRNLMYEFREVHINTILAALNQSSGDFLITQNMITTIDEMRSDTLSIYNMVLVQRKRDNLHDFFRDLRSWIHQNYQRARRLHQEQRTSEMLTEEGFIIDNVSQVVKNLRSLNAASDSLRTLINSAGKQNIVTMFTAKRCLEGDYNFTLLENESVNVSVHYETEGKIYKILFEEIKNARAQALLTTGQHASSRDSTRQTRNSKSSDAEQREQEEIEYQKKFLHSCSLVDDITDALGALIRLGHPSYTPNDFCIICKQDQLEELKVSSKTQLDRFAKILQKFRKNYPHIAFLTGLELRTIFFGDKPAAFGLLRTINRIRPPEHLSLDLQTIQQEADRHREDVKELYRIIPGLLDRIAQDAAEKSKRSFTDLEIDSPFRGVKVVRLNPARMYAGVLAILKLTHHSEYLSLSNVLFGSPETTSDELHAFVQQAKHMPDRVFVIAHTEMLPHNLQTKHFDNLLSSQQEKLNIVLLVSQTSTAKYSFEKCNIPEKDLEFVDSPPRTTLVVSTDAGMGKTHFINKETGYKNCKIHISGEYSRKMLFDIISSSLVMPEDEDERLNVHFDIGRSIHMMQARQEETNGGTDNAFTEPNATKLFTGASTTTILDALFSIIYFGCLRGNGQVLWIPIEESAIYIEPISTKQAYLSSVFQDALGFDERTTRELRFSWDDLDFENELFFEISRKCAYTIDYLRRPNVEEEMWNLPNYEGADVDIQENLRQIYSLDISAFRVNIFDVNLLTYRLLCDTLTLFASYLDTLSNNTFYGINTLMDIKEYDLNSVILLQRELLYIFLAKARANSVASYQLATNLLEQDAHQDDIISWDKKKRLSFVLNPQDPLGAMIPWYPTIKDGGISQHYFPPQLEILFKSQDDEWELEDVNGFSQEKYKSTLHSAFCHPADRQLTELDPSYCLTPDNIFKMILIYQRVYHHLPVVLQGEAGVGKTRLVRYLANILNMRQGEKRTKFISLTMNEGTDISLLLETVEMAKEKAKTYKLVILFLDEINTSPHIDELSNFIIGRTIRGIELPPNVSIVSAMNPRRVIDEEKLDDAGLDEVVSFKSRLVYRVYKAPQRLMQLAFDFGSLHQLDEQSYIKKIVETAPELSELSIRRNVNLERENYFENHLSNIVITCHDFLRYHSSSTPWTCSLRDVRRFVRFFRFFEMNMPLFIFPSKTPPKATTTFIKIAFLAMYVTYIVRLPLMKQRKKLVKKVCKKFLKGKKLHREFDRFIADARNNVLSRFKLDEGIAKNLSFGENALVLISGICARIPVIVVGQPGSSKSLALTNVLNFMGGMRIEEKNLKIPKVLSLSYQGSDISTTEGILTVARRVSGLVPNADRDEMKTIGLFIFDELGLAQLAPANPLKVLHDILEPTGCRRHLLKTSVKSQASEIPPFAFVGLSNHILDAAPTSRSIVLFRPTPTNDELIETLKTLFMQKCKTITEENVQPIAERIAASHYEVINFANESGFKGWVGTRDVYSFTKMYAEKFSANAQSTTDIVHCVSRCYGGMSPEILQHIIRVFTQNLDSIEEDYSIPSAMSVFLKNIQDSSLNARHLCLIGDGSMVPILEKRIKKQDQRKVLILRGSSLEGDKGSGDFAHDILSKLINAANNGNIVFLVGLRSIYGACYDLLNRNYIPTPGNAGICRIALGAASDSLCQVSDNFRMIITMTPEEAMQEEPALLQRLEKLRISTNDILAHDKLNSTELASLREASRKLEVDNIPIFSYENIVFDIFILGRKHEDEQEDDFTNLLAMLVSVSTYAKLQNNYLNVPHSPISQGHSPTGSDAIVLNVIQRCREGGGAFPTLQHLIVYAVDTARNNEQSASCVSFLRSGLSSYDIPLDTEELSRVLGIRTFEKIPVGASNTAAELRNYFTKFLEKLVQNLDQKEFVVLIPIDGEFTAHIDTILHLFSSVRTNVQGLDQKIHTFIIISNPLPTVVVSPLSSWTCTIVDSFRLPPALIEGTLEANPSAQPLSSDDTLHRLITIDKNIQVSKKLLSEFIMSAFYAFRFPSTEYFNMVFSRIRALQAELEKDESRETDAFLETVNREFSNLMSARPNWAESIALNNSPNVSFNDALVEDFQRLIQIACIRLLAPMIELGILFPPTHDKGVFSEFPREADMNSRSLWRDILLSKSGLFMETMARYRIQLDEIFAQLPECRAIPPGIINIHTENPNQTLLPYSVFLSTTVLRAYRRFCDMMRCLSNVPFQYLSEQVENFLNEEGQHVSGSPIFLQFINTLFSNGRKAGTEFYLKLFCEIEGFTSRHENKFSEKLLPNPHLLWGFVHSQDFEDTRPRAGKSHASLRSKQPDRLVDLVLAVFFEQQNFTSQHMFLARIDAFDILRPIFSTHKSNNAVNAICGRESFKIANIAVRKLLEKLIAHLEGTPLSEADLEDYEKFPPFMKTWIRSSSELLELGSRLYPQTIFCGDKSKWLAHTELSVALLQLVLDVLNTCPALFSKIFPSIKNLMKYLKSPRNLEKCKEIDPICFGLNCLAEEPDEPTLFFMQNIYPQFFEKVLTSSPLPLCTAAIAQLPAKCIDALAPGIVGFICSTKKNIKTLNEFNFFLFLMSDNYDEDPTVNLEQTGWAFFEEFLGSALEEAFSSGAVPSIVSALYSFLVSHVLMTNTPCSSLDIEELSTFIFSDFFNPMNPEEMHAYMTAAYNTVLHVSQAGELGATKPTTLITSLALLNVAAITCATQVVLGEGLDAFSEQLLKILPSIAEDSLMCGPLVSILRNGVIIQSDYKFFDSLRFNEYVSDDPRMRELLCPFSEYAEDVDPNIFTFQTDEMETNIELLRTELRKPSVELPVRPLLEACSLFTMPECEKNTNEPAIILGRILATEPSLEQNTSVGHRYCIARVWAEALQGPRDGPPSWLHELMHLSQDELRDRSVFIPTMWPCADLYQLLARAHKDEIEKASEDPFASSYGQTLLGKGEDGSLKIRQKFGKFATEQDASQVESQPFTFDYSKYFEYDEDENVSWKGKTHSTKTLQHIGKLAVGGIVLEPYELFDGDSKYIWEFITEGVLPNKFHTSQAGMLLHFIVNTVLWGRHELACAVPGLFGEEGAAASLSESVDDRMYFFNLAQASYTALKRSFGKLCSAEKRISDILEAVLPCAANAHSLPRSWNAKEEYEKNLLDAYSKEISGLKYIRTVLAHTHNPFPVRDLLEQAPIPPEVLPPKSRFAATLMELRQPFELEHLQSSLPVVSYVQERYPLTTLFFQTPPDRALLIAALPFVSQLAHIGWHVCSMLTAREAGDLTIGKLIDPDEQWAERLGIFHERLENIIIDGIKAWGLAFPNTIPFGQGTLDAQINADSSVLAICPDNVPPGLVFLLGMQLLIKAHNEFYFNHAGILASEQLSEESQKTELDPFTLRPRDGFYNCPVAFRESHDHPPERGVLTLDRWRNIYALQPDSHTQSVSLLPLPPSEAVSLPHLEQSLRAAFLGRRRVASVPKSKSRAPLLDRKLAHIDSLLCDFSYAVDGGENLSEPLQRDIRYKARQANPVKLLGEFRLLMYAALQLWRDDSDDSDENAQLTVRDLIALVSVGSACPSILSMPCVRDLPAHQLIQAYSVFEKVFPLETVWEQLTPRYKAPLAAVQEEDLALQFPTRDKWKLLAELIQIQFCQYSLPHALDMPFDAFLTQAKYVHGPSAEDIRIPESIRLENFGGVLQWLLEVENEDLQKRKRRDAALKRSREQLRAKATAGRR
eukprot:gnl/Chilomastix_cuspidata/1873.p1 GENE.gnl/Chilomastix_cuspidata/1873~~gnl/Chilomastix_cuspidata/1873.p1  ORF type:complete len:4896 (-),score=868.34 gnl/Chilomastix_cuspidata/1873:28-14715(-)